jgi:alkanesulfonate monooxygenase SsuD/methylene tetrahydromethanopterin reductase-like flavin-dependent oxidoreductase (luciferase family)/nicotinamidase-related amidase
VIRGRCEEAASDGRRDAPRTGVLFSLCDDLELVCRAEELGYESVWAAEGQGRTAFGKLERWATATDEVGLGTGVVNVFARTPAALAQAVATLDAHSGGRAILGLGVAHPGVVEAFHGVEFERPLARLAEYVELVRRYLRGDPEGFDGEFFSPRRTRFWTAFDPERADIPVYNAALGPDNVRLTGARADGWLPNLYPADRLETALDWLSQGAARADRPVADVDVAMYVLTAVHEDPAVARRAAAEHVAYYLREIPGYYDRLAREAGFEADVAAVRAADSLDAGAARVGDDFLDSVAITGPAATVREKLASLRAAGVDLPIVRAPAGTDREWIERTLSAVAPVGEGHKAVPPDVSGRAGMTEHIWDDLLSEQDERVITKAGYDEAGASSWESRGLGENPMVLVIDMQRLVVGENVPILEAVEDYRTAMGEIAWEAIDHIEPFLSFVRERGLPVTYTRVIPSSYDDPDHEDLAIVDPVAPEPEDTVIDKSYASAFYGTDLLSRLVRDDHDSVIIVGNSTSGCVRATSVDAQQHGFDVILPQECLFDRIEASHKIGLLDLWMKYAEVQERSEVEAYVESVT